MTRWEPNCDPRCGLAHYPSHHWLDPRQICQYSKDTAFIGDTNDNAKAAAKKREDEYLRANPELSNPFKGIGNSLFEAIADCRLPAYEDPSLVNPKQRRNWIW